ncbi:DUF4279 domain-containing protein [Polluticoccus soli]|uniref:DUF4279 domain-containing protein n=1 Tax=Polluticoccus soli TaxID=3034150 RepID=UPI0023E16EE9|nr:DUF4279 domain-containing protein [Flavipsychrobacter sp. JY13-12]
MEQQNKEALILEKVFAEVNNPTWAMLEQFLTAHQIDYENGKPKVVHIDMTNPERALVYLAVRGQDFYYGAWVDTKDEIQLNWMDALPKIDIFLLAESETLTAEEMAALTRLDTQVARRIGELKSPKAKVEHKDSAIFIEPNPNPGFFDDKLLQLVDLLDDDKEGIRALAQKAETYIVATCLYYSGYWNLGQLKVDPKITKRIVDLNLGIAINLQAWGDPILEEPDVEELLQKLKEKDLRELEERKKPTRIP